MPKTYHMTINEDVKCKQCGKGGACKAEDGEYGLCLDCVNKNLERIRTMEMMKTYKQTQAEVANQIESEWERIVNAYRNSDCELGISIKVSLAGNLQVVEIVTELGYYPLPKTKIKTDPVTMDERQRSLPLREVG